MVSLELVASRAAELTLVGGELALDFANTASARATRARQDHLQRAEDVALWAGHAKVLAPDDAQWAGGSGARAARRPAARRRPGPARRRLPARRGDRRRPRGADEPSDAARATLVIGDGGRAERRDLRELAYGQAVADEDGGAPRSASHHRDRREPRRRRRASPRSSRPRAGTPRPRGSDSQSGESSGNASDSSSATTSPMWTARARLSESTSACSLRISRCACSSTCSYEPATGALPICSTTRG